MKKGKHRISALVEGRVKRIPVEVVDTLAFASGKVDDNAKYRVAVHLLASGEFLVWRQRAYLDAGETEELAWLVTSVEDARQVLLDGGHDDALDAKAIRALDKRAQRGEQTP